MFLNRLLDIFNLQTAHDLVCDNAEMKRCPAQYQKKKKKMITQGWFIEIQTRALDRARARLAYRADTGLTICCWLDAPPAHVTPFDNAPVCKVEPCVHALSTRQRRMNTRSE